MFRDVAFGQYYPANSFVHKMDARVKILLSIAYIVAVIMIESFFRGKPKSGDYRDYFVAGYGYVKKYKN